MYAFYASKGKYTGILCTAKDFNTVNGKTTFLKIALLRQYMNLLVTIFSVWITVSVSIEKHLWAFQASFIL